MKAIAQAKRRVVWVAQGSSVDLLCQVSNLFFSLKERDKPTSVVGCVKLVPGQLNVFGELWWHLVLGELVR